jgi:hypothetical protein
LIRQEIPANHLMQQIVPDVRAEMIAKARSRTLENRWTQDRRDRPDLEDYMGLS